MSIQIQNVSKRFGNFTALDDINLDLPSGKLISLLGPSGCGKTTLLRIVAGLEHPETGRIVLHGLDTSGKHVRDRKVGFVFQHYALFRHMTIFDNVAFGLRMRPRKTRLKEKAIRERVERLLNLVQLDWVGDRYPSQLSGGQRQRVALARALAIEPEILLLDEPFGALDAQVRKELRRWLRKLHDELPITSLFVTHDQEEALEVSDTIVLMNGGRVEQVGPPEALYHHPETSFVAGFIGAVNRFHARTGPDGIDLGSGTVPHVGNASETTFGKEVLAFARPHEIDILTGPGVTNGLSAEITRIRSFGLVSRVELKGVNGHSHQVFDVEVPTRTAETQGLHHGMRVNLMPSELRFYEHDAGFYEI